MRRILPWRVRAAFDRVWQPVVFQRAMRRFLAAPQACEDPANPVLRELIYGWGNASWSADTAYLAACIREAARADGAVLEAGSGLSTVLAGHVAARRGKPYIALEHQPVWADKVRAVLERFHINGVEVRHAPLADFGAALWYDPGDELPPSFSLVLCDGPPGHGRGGRSGLVACMRDRLVPGTVLLVDDCQREPEQRMVREWSEALPASVTIRRGTDEFAFAALCVLEGTPPGGVTPAV